MSYKVPNHVTWKNLDEGMVLLNLNSSQYYTLNKTASIIWLAITESKSEETILQILLEQFICDEEQCRMDLKEQLGFLSDEGLITT
jgi:hypothetical protein